MALYWLYTYSVLQRKKVCLHYVHYTWTDYYCYNYYGALDQLSNYLFWGNPFFFSLCFSFVIRRSSHLFYHDQCMYICKYVFKANSIKFPFFYLSISYFSLYHFLKLHTLWACLISKRNPVNNNIINHLNSHITPLLLLKIDISLIPFLQRTVSKSNLPFRKEQKLA